MPKSYIYMCVLLCVRQSTNSSNDNDDNNSDDYMTVTCIEGAMRPCPTPGRRCSIQVAAELETVCVYVGISACSIIFCAFCV